MESKPILEFVAFLATVGGCTFAYIQYKNEKNSSSEKRKLLIEKIEFGKNSCNKLISELQMICVANHCWNEIFMQNLTYNQCIEMLQKSINELYNDEMINILKKHQVSKERIESLSHRVEDNNQRFMEINTVLQYFTKQEMVKTPSGYMQNDNSKNY